MLNYWVVTVNFYPVWAGPSERFMRYAKISESLGIRISFKTFDRGLNIPYEVLDNAHVFRYKTESYKELLNIVAREIELDKNKPDAVLIIGLAPYIKQFNKKIQRQGVKSLYISTMDFDLVYRGNGKKRDIFRLFLYTRLFKSMINSFDFIVSSSRYLSNQYNLKLGIGQDKLKVIPNGVNTNIFKPDFESKAKLRQELNLPENEIVFLFVGLMIERKGILPLLTAWSEYKTAGGEGSLILVGNDKRYDGDEAYYQLYQQLKNTLEVQNSQARFIGAHSEIHKFFKASDAFVFLSNLEGMPNVLLEAMATATPIILNPFKGFSSDYGAHNETYLQVDNNKVDTIVNAFNLISNDSDLRAKLGRNGYDLIQRKFVVETSITSYASICKE